ncbi:DNA topoisomerase 3 [Sulfitobacter sp. R18_1]|uniref:DNA topoisomerase 3 n=1 Tax=Sulfitobacter sp. R18_1 TaxID=2821104 RepID=UPI001ADB7039|nr:DNA topoisomerase 3 [Sulfitobacter sp. R18_1]MBO9428529.1 DNA topoisomerase 3 [Sulfitobacter sp. R18_1]
MTDYLFIAEKPSLAEAVAKARAEEKGISASKSRGYWEVGDDKVCWLFGHMYQQVNPAAYNPRYKSWILDDLPIVPEKWKLEVSQGKQDQVSSIARLLKDAKNVVNVGDAAREGQLLVDELLIENGWDAFSPNTHRLWVRSVARKDLLKALGDMKPNKTKEALYHAAICRQRADWLLGMNLSRLFTILAQQSGSDQTISVGRVQTPTLALVVARDLEIKNFKPVDHFLPSGLFKHANGTFNATWIIPDDCDHTDSEGRLTDKSYAEQVLERVAGKTGEITKYSATDKSKSAPLPFSLSALQTECSAKLGLTAQQTLDVGQKLYDAGIMTYPRSDCRYLPMSIFTDEADKIIAKLVDADGGLGEAAKGATATIKSSAWNDSKVSDHHGIVPTMDISASKISALTGVERKVFDIVAKSFLAQFYPAQRWKALSAEIKVEDDKFKASGRRDIDAGWRVVYTGEKEDTEEDNADENPGQSLPEMAKGDSVAVDKGELQSKRTTPPSAFTDGTLISAMSNIHKFVPDTEIKKKLKENAGIGTEATRAPMLEEMIKRKFLQRKGKKVVSTITGQSIIEALPEEVKDPAMTAVWESYLDKVAVGELPLEKFMEGQIKSLQARIDAGKGTEVRIKGGKTITPLEGHGKECPECKQGQLITRELKSGKAKGKKLLACNRWPDCKGAEWPQIKIDPVEGHGKPCEKCSEGKMVTRMIGKGKHKGKKFLSCDTYPKCDHVDWLQPKIEPVKGHGDSCQKCSEGKMVTRMIHKGDNKGKKFLSCDQYPKCDHVDWLRPKVDPIEGHGKDCPACKEGKLVTKQSRDGKKTFLSCNAYPKCKHAEFQNNVPPMEGDGKTCDKCKEGKMITREIGKGKNKGKTFLSCNKYPKCENTKWPD